MWLSADWHLTAKPEDEYRWDVFRRLRELTRDPSLEHEIVVLGDITDHKTDKHPAALVNRLVDELLSFVRRGNTTVTIIMGNHDAPLNGVPYWDFLNELPNVNYLSKPTGNADTWFLPYTKAPQWDWKKLDFKRCKLIFMHQAVAGANIGNGRKINEDLGVSFPRGCRVYAGDIHTPQTVGNVTYVGAPHWVRFGDTHERRLLRIDDTTYKIAEEIKITDGARKLIANVRSLADLTKLDVNAGDQVRVRYSVGDIASVPEMSAEIQAWAVSAKVSLVSVETALEGDEQTAEAGDFLHEPGSILHAFAKYEALTCDLYEAGARLLADLLPSTEIPSY